jgi:superfamily I DNA and/or RNA helicase
MTDVWCTVSWDIQGREYKAVFICTTEPVDSKHSPEETTKSLCETTVFNTMITRACSLVVACGNPLRILQIESKLADSKHCWMEFLHRCMENKSLLLSERLSEERSQFRHALDLLEKIMLDRASRNLMCLPSLKADTGDSIIQSYNEEFKKKNITLALGQVRNDSGWKLWEDQIGEEVLVPETTKYVEVKDSVKCRLWQTSHGDCVAIPYNRLEQKFTVKADKRRCAFEGAHVKVEEIGKNIETGQRFGRVCQILEQGSSQPVLCEVDKNNVIAFYSVDGKSPKFLNLPHVTKQLLDEISEKDLRDHLSRPKKYISCFDPKSLEKGNVPKISDNVPLVAAVNLLFVVQPLYWTPKHRHPIGAVVGAFPKGSSIDHGMKILSIQYQVPDDDICMDTKRPPPPLEPDSPHAIGIKGVNGYCQLAFSVETKSDSTNQLHEIGIYVPDITHYICNDRWDFDDHVRHRASYIGECKGTKVYHSVLPKQVLESASFNSSHPVRCFAIRFVVPAEDLGSREYYSQDVCEVYTEKCVLCESIVDYDELEAVLHSTHATQATPLVTTLKDEIHVLFQLAEKLHFNRKGHNAYSNLEPHSYSYPDAWKLVNEFKVLMNRTAAKKMAGSFPKHTLLKVQPPLSEHSEGEIINAFSSFSKFTVQYHQIQFDRHPGAGDVRIRLAHNVCSRLLSVLEDASPDFLLIRQLLSLPMYHAHLLVLDAVISDHVPREEYAVKKIVSKSGKELKSRLDQLTRPKEVPQLAHYTQEAVCSSVTSPFDSVFDIHAQTLLKVATAEGSDKSVGVSHEKFLEIARKCNMSTANANNYSIALSSLNLATCAQSSSVCVDTVIKHLSDGIISLAYHHPSLTMPSVSEIKLSCLTGSSKLNKVPVSLRIASVTGPLRVLTHRSYQKVKKNKTQIHVFSLSSESGNLKQFKYPIKYVPKDASVSLEQWSAALEFTKDPTKESAKKLSSFLKEFMKSEFPNSYQVLPLSRTLEDLSAEKTNKDYLSTETAMEPWDVPEVLFVILKAPFEFTQLQTLKVWLRADTTEYVATPKPQILELNCDVRVCLQHMQEPEACFTSGVVAQSPKVQYSSIKHYCRIWEDLILAEAAVNSIRGALSQTYLFSDFKLTFSGFQVPQDCFGEDFYEPSGEISSELTKEFLETRQDIFPFQKGDFICARYEIDLEKVEQCIKRSLKYDNCLHPAASDKCARFVIHMIVDEVVKMDDDAIIDETDSELDSEVMMAEDAPPVHCNVKVKFKIENIAKNRLSPLMKDLLECNKFTCELQVIPMFLPYRRIYFTLKQMPLLQPKCLAHMIAMGDVKRLLRMEVTNSKDYLEYIQVITKKRPLCFQRWFGDTDKELNHDQKKAIRCSLMNRFQLIQGPPGTGKSVTGAHIAYAFAMVNRQFHPPSLSTKSEKNKPRYVLYCGPTNVSVDVVFQMLAKVSDNRKDRADKLRVLRIYGRGIEQQFYPDPFSNSDVFVKNYSLTMYKLPTELEDFTLHHLIRRKYSPFGKTLKELEEKFKKCHEKGEIPTPADRIRYRETVVEAERDIIMKGNFDVVLCTCNESSSSRIKSYIQPIQCIIDEASMVNEAESMASISIAEHVVIIGDHKQLQPVVTSETAKHNSMNISLFERYASFLHTQYHEELHKSHYPLFIRLGNQYRMLKQICYFPSLMFYGGQLKTKVEAMNPRKRVLENFWLKLGNPLVFCNVVGEEETEAEESMIGSKKNRKEAEKTAEIVEHMARFMALQGKPSEWKKIRVGILTFYKAQKKLIEDTLKEKHLEACAAVKTVDASQGSEYDYVILSTVRSKSLDKLKSDRIVHTDKHWRHENLGFVTDSHRLCVALTRACFGLIIIGNAELLQSDDMWKNLIEHYNEGNYMCTENEFPTPYVKKRIPKSARIVPHAYFLKKDEDEEMEQTRHDAWALALKELPKAAKKMSRQPYMHSCNYII